MTRESDQRAGGPRRPNLAFVRFPFAHDRRPITSPQVSSCHPSPSALPDHRRAFAARHVIGGRSFSSINRETSMAKNFALVSLSDAVRQRRSVSDRRLHA